MVGNASANDSRRRARPPRDPVTPRKRSVTVPAHRRVIVALLDGWENQGMTEPVVRVTLLEQSLPDKITAAMQVRRIALQPNVMGGAHHHNGPVFGAIETGSVVFQVHGGLETTLRAGDVFYEPEDVLIDRFDATSEGVTFLGYFLSGPGESPELIPGLPSA